MPPAIKDKTDEQSEDDEVFEETAAELDVDAQEQLNGELKDKVEPEEDEAEDEDEPEPEPKALPVKAAAKGRQKKTAAIKGRGDEDGEKEEDDEEDEEGEEYSVEAIREHQFFKGQLLYFIKWQGYPDEDNTWEPEDHLQPHARNILAAYHKKHGGQPQAPIRRGKSKQSLRTVASSEDLPASKRQKRNGAKLEEELGTWMPKGIDWEDQIDKVETIERNEDTDKLMAFIRFKNGKRTKITMEMVYRHCPRPMLRFYEANLKFK